MSFTDPVDDVQPDTEGQGDEASGGSPWESYLTRFPEEARDTAAEVLREMETNANKKFEDHASFRKQWEPLQETGVRDRDPGQVSWAMQFLDALDQPELIQGWFESYAKENGLSVQEAQQEAADDFGFQDPQQQFEKLLEERLNPLLQKLEQYDGRFQQQDQQQEIAKAGVLIDRQIAVIEKDHGKLDDEQMQLLARFAEQYTDDGEHCIERGWADLQHLLNAHEKKVLNGKVNQPAPAESGGIPSVTPEEHKRIDSAGVKDAALEFLRNNNRA